MLLCSSFMDKFGFPGVIGAIDGTQVAIVQPVEHEETFFNRKGYHSINVLAVSTDFKALFMNFIFLLKWQVGILYLTQVV